MIKVGTISTKLNESFNGLDCHFRVIDKYTIEIVAPYETTADDFDNALSQFNEATQSNFKVNHNNWYICDNGKEIINKITEYKPKPTNLAGIFFIPFLSNDSLYFCFTILALAALVFVANAIQKRS